MSFLRNCLVRYSMNKLENGDAVSAGWAEFFSHKEEDPWHQIPEFDIDLDRDPEDRWQEGLSPSIGYMY